MSCLQTTKACGLTQPPIVVTTKVCSYAILKNVSIFLTIVTTLPSVVIPIVRGIIASYLVWCPCRLGSTFKCSMSILLTIVVVSFKFWCIHGSSSAFMCLMTLFFALVTVGHVLWLSILICILSCKHQLYALSFHSNDKQVWNSYLYCSSPQKFWMILLLQCLCSPIMLFLYWIQETSVVSQSI